MSFPGNLTKPITCIYLWQKMIKYQREIVAGGALIIDKVQQDKITERKREIWHDIKDILQWIMRWVGCSSAVLQWCSVREMCHYSKANINIIIAETIVSRHHYHHTVRPKTEATWTKDALGSNERMGKKSKAAVLCRLRLNERTNFYIWSLIGPIRWDVSYVTGGILESLRGGR